MSIDRNGVDLDHDPADEEYWRAAIELSFQRAADQVGPERAERLMREALLMVTGKDTPTP